MEQVDAEIYRNVYSLKKVDTTGDQTPAYSNGSGFSRLTDW